jgi:hypothetical protein
MASYRKECYERGDFQYLEQGPIFVSTDVSFPEPYKSDNLFNEGTPRTETYHMYHMGMVYRIHLYSFIAIFRDGLCLGLPPTKLVEHQAVTRDRFPDSFSLVLLFLRHEQN